MRERTWCRYAKRSKRISLAVATILRCFASESTKNKLYFAFRELGRIIRTLFLLKYLSDPELRRTIHAATNKSEQFNDFARLLMFGGEGVIAGTGKKEMTCCPAQWLIVLRRSENKNRTST
jgi:TnpA family transposase